MLRSDEQWLTVADGFYDAALDQQLWYAALERLAAATGSRTGQLISLGNNAAVPLNILTNVDPAAEEEFIACGGGDPAINPRVKAGMRTPVLEVIAESDFLTPDEWARNRHYQEYACRWDLPFICLTNLERCSDLLIGLAVVRSAREGHIEPDERAVFASLATHARAAVRMQIALEGKGAALVKGTLEALALPAFVCGRTGIVLGLTSQAEELVRSERGLAIRNRLLRAQRDDEDRSLSEAIERAARGLERPGAPPMQTVVVRGATDASTPIVLDVMSLPSLALDFYPGPRVVVVARGARGADECKVLLLQGVYGLTSAEANVALLLTQGKSTEAIAQERKVAVGTVRAQIKSVFAKLNVSRQVELVAKLNEF